MTRLTFSNLVEVEPGFTVFYDKKHSVVTLDESGKLRVNGELLIDLILTHTVYFTR